VVYARVTTLSFKYHNSSTHPPANLCGLRKGKKDVKHIVFCRENKRRKDPGQLPAGLGRSLPHFSIEINVFYKKLF